MRKERQQGERETLEKTKIRSADFNGNLRGIQAQVTYVFFFHFLRAFGLGFASGSMRVEQKID